MEWQVHDVRVINQRIKVSAAGSLQEKIARTRSAARKVPPSPPNPN
jgi:hypothetical protein